MIILSTSHTFSPTLIQRLCELGVEISHESWVEDPMGVHWEEACLFYKMASDNDLVLFLLGTELLPPCKLKVTGPNFTVLLR